MAAVHPAQSLLFVSAPQRANRDKGADIVGNILVFHDDPASHEELREVLEAFMLLPEGESEILMLAGPGGLTYQEMAARFVRADGTMKSSLRRARASLVHSLAVVKTRPGRKPQERSAAARRIGISDRRGCEPDRPA